PRASSLETRKPGSIRNWKSPALDVSRSTQLEAELTPQDDGPTAVNRNSFVIEVLAENGEVRDAQVRMIESVIELPTNQEAVALPELDCLLRGEVPSFKAGRDERIAAHITVAGAWDDEVKAVGIPCRAIVAEEAVRDAVDARRQAE